KIALLALNVAILDEELGSATGMDGSARSSLELLRTQLARAHDRTLRGFFLINLDALTNGFARSYFPWNLRCTQTFTVWLLEPDAERRAQLLEYADRPEWTSVRDDENPWFTFQPAIMHGTSPSSSDPAFAAALANLKAVALRPV